MEKPRGLNLKDIGRVGSALLLAGSALVTAPARADQGVMLNLIPPEGSVTPQAFGNVSAEVLSSNQYNLVLIHVRGNVSGLIPGRKYQPWICWNTPADCSTRGPGVETDQAGSASFDEKIDIFNRPNHPIASIRIAQVTEGEVPADACFLVSDPCLSVPYSINH